MNNMEKKMNKNVDEFMKESVNFLAYISMAALTESESKAMLDLFKNNEEIETEKGIVFGFNTGVTRFDQDTDSIRADIWVKDYSHVADVLKELLQKANVQSKIKIPGRAFDFSMECWCDFADGEFVASSSHNYYDNGILYSGEETFIETTAKKCGVDLETLTYEDADVFDAFLNQDITKWSYAFRPMDGENPVEILKPKSLMDLMVYYSALMSTGFDDGVKMLEEYVARRDGRKPVPANLPDELKKTFGLVFFYEQVPFLSDPDLSVPHPMLMVAAELSVKCTYQFVYLCQKFGVHKDLK